MQHHFEMQDGVIHVYPNKDCKRLPFCDFLLCHDSQSSTCFRISMYIYPLFSLVLIVFFSVSNQQKKSYTLLRMLQPFSLTCITFFELLHWEI